MNSKNEMASRPFRFGNQFCDSVLQFSVILKQSDPQLDPTWNLEMSTKDPQKPSQDTFWLYWSHLGAQRSQKRHGLEAVSFQQLIWGHRIVIFNKLDAE